MNKNFQARQGDLFIEKLSNSFKKDGLTKKNDNILAYGEATGHSHQLVDFETKTAPNFDNVEMYSDQRGDIFINLKTAQKFELKHDEHGPITLDGPGGFCITRQREYDADARDQERRVAD